MFINIEEPLKKIALSRSEKSRLEGIRRKYGDYRSEMALAVLLVYAAKTITGGWTNCCPGLENYLCIAGMADLPQL